MIERTDATAQHLAPCSKSRYFIQPQASSRPQRTNVSALTLASKCNEIDEIICRGQPRNDAQRGWNQRRWTTGWPKAHSIHGRGKRTRPRHLKRVAPGYWRHHKTNQRKRFPTRCHIDDGWTTPVPGNQQKWQPATLSQKRTDLPELRSKSVSVAQTDHQVTAQQVDRTLTVPDGIASSGAVAKVKPGTHRRYLGKWFITTKTSESLPAIKPTARMLKPVTWVANGLLVHLHNSMKSSRYVEWHIFACVCWPALSIQTLNWLLKLISAYMW
jgi:hypothetical protein